MTALLVLIVCIGTDCRDIAPPLDPVPLTVCLIKGEEAAQPWLNDHPKYSLRGWRCQVGQRERAL
jgi:hypothetical protein